MRIGMKRYGEVLVTPKEGEEAFYSADENFFQALKEDESIILDFIKVRVLSPSWLDEFVTRIKEKYTNKIEFHNTENESVSLSIKIVLS